MNDHLLWATEIGKYIHNKFKKENYNIDRMIKNQLFENIFLRGKAKVLKVI